jgi:hypothetical protein
MAWVHDGRYYQKSIRRDGRVMNQYFGCTLWAYEQCRLDQVERAKCERRRRENRKTAETERNAYEIERRRGESLRTLTTIGLQSLGFVRYQRGYWTRRRMRTLPRPALTAEQEKGVRAEIHNAVDRVWNGEFGAAGELTRLADRHPEIVADSLCTDLAYHAQKRLLGEGDDRAKQGRELMALMALIAAELAGENPSPARRLTAEVAGFAYGEFWLLTLVAAHEGVASQSAQAVKRRTAAQKRFLQAVKTVSQIAALERPKRVAIFRET